MRLLVFQHIAIEHPGIFREFLKQDGIRWDAVELDEGQPIPDLRAYDALWVMGGPMDVWDVEENPWLIPEKRAIRQWVRELKRPFLGICLGAQMLVNHLGGKVAGHGDGLVEIGWYPLAPTEEGKALMHWPEMVYQFHREGFSLPRDATLLATAETYPNQAFRYGDNAWGIQFHGELTRAMMQRWVVRGAHRFELPGAQPGRDHLGGRLIWDMHLKRWLGEFMQTIFGRPCRDKD